MKNELTTTLNDYYSPLDNVVTIREVQEDPKNLDISSHVMMDALRKQVERLYSALPILYVDYALRVHTFIVWIDDCNQRLPRGQETD